MLLSSAGYFMGFESSSSSTEAVTEIERARARDEIERVRALGMERVS